MNKSLKSFGKLGKSFKKLPPKYRLWVSAGILVALLVALPITLIGFMTGTFELRKRAVTGEPTPTPPPSVTRPAIQVVLFGDTNHNMLYEPPDEGALTGFNVDIWVCKLNEHYTECDYSSSAWTNGDASVTFSSLPLGTYHAWIHTGLPQGWYSTFDVVSLGRGEYQTAYVPLSQSDYYSRPTPTPAPQDCVGEGGTGLEIEGDECCPGFEKIGNFFLGPGGGLCTGPTDSSFVCSLDCGDGRCTLAENECNCSEDCGLPLITPTASPSATPTPVGQGNVEGYVFLDVNLNHLEDPGEHRLTGIQVQLYLAEEGIYTQQWNTLTYSGGVYSFSELVPGEYHLTLGTSNFTTVGGNQDFTITGDETIAGAIFGIHPSDITPTPITQTLQFTLKFEGVTSRPLDDTDKQVQIYATSYDGGAPIGSADSKETVVLSVDDSGIYHGEITLTSAFGYFGYHYRLRVKGPKHLQVVFPDVVFQEGVELDLTGQTLRPGDLNLDSRVDKSDLQLINDRIFSTDPADVALADVNFDQIVDIIDRTLVLNTLSVYYDPD